MTAKSENIRSTNSQKRKRDRPNPDPASKPLMLCFGLIKELLDAGAETNSHDGTGSTVLMSVITSFQEAEDANILTSLMEYLIEKGANVHWRNRKG